MSGLARATSALKRWLYFEVTMKKQYTYDYDMGEGKITFEVDTEKFTEEMAKEILSFFGDESDEPMEEVMKMYAVGCLQAARGLYFILPEYTAQRFNDHVEGMYPVNEGHGIKIVDVDYSEINEYDLQREI